MSWKDWAHRHLQAPDPQEPASPPPFAIGERVIATIPAVGAGDRDHARHGKVVAVEFVTDPDNPYGPWMITVLLDGETMKAAFHAAELTREPKPARHLATPEPEEDFAADEPVPYLPVVGPEREQLPDTPSADPTPFAIEVRNGIDGPVAARAEFEVEKVFADKVEADLAELTARNASRRSES